VTYDQQRMVRIGETWLTPHIDANGVGPDPTWTWDGADFRESELCGPEGVLCPGPESWERLNIGELPGGRLRFTLAGPAVPPGWTVDEALVHDDVVLGFDRTPDRCSSEDHAVVDGHLSRDGSSFWGRVAYHWPAGCEVAGRVLSEPLRIDRGFAARRVIDRP
ncbi:MAG: hypothetical protein H6735_32690, partial [Alphaproteobacteria bacterium]|nr:hypothetical protein [Alphaproteobacteria bacterium]